MFDPKNFDPSKLDPKTLMELSNLVRELPPAQLNKMQSIMHNMMAGFDVRKEMEEFEKTLPPAFRERLMGIMAGKVGPATGTGVAPATAPEPIPHEAPPASMDVRSARMTVLQAVAEGRMSPDEAERILFPE